MYDSGEHLMEQHHLRETHARGRTGGAGKRIKSTIINTKYVKLIQDVYNIHMNARTYQIGIRVQVRAGAIDPSPARFRTNQEMIAMLCKEVVFASLAI